MRTMLAAIVVMISLAGSGCDSGTKVSGLEPSFGNISGNDQIIILGKGFKPGMVVRFGKKEAKSVVIESSSRMIVKTPSGAEGKVDVTVTTDDGKTFVLNDGFEYRRDAPKGQ